MKQHILFIFFLIFVFPIKHVSAQDIIFDWKYTATTGYSEGKCIATDSAGYVYVGGIINGSATFMDTTISASGSYNSFVAKLTPAGKMVWFKWFKSGYCRLSSMCFDRENKFYVAGTYGGSMEIQGDTTLSTNNAQPNTTQMFIIKYDTAGTMQWTKNTSGLYYTIGNGAMPSKKIAVDTENNLIVTGRCYDDLLYFDTTAVVPYNYPETGFLAKYNSNGQKLWVKKIGGANCYPYAVKCDNESNIITTGYFSDPALFDTIIVHPTVNSGESIFIAKYTNIGIVNWAQRAGGYTIGDNGGFSIAVDSINNIYLTGCYSGGGEFGGVQFISHGAIEAFVVKYDAIGSAKWAKPIGTSHITGAYTNNCGFSIIIKNSKIYLLGSFMDTLVFGNVTLQSDGKYETFLLKLDLNGNVLEAGQYLAHMFTYPQEMAIDNNNNIYISGFQSTKIFIAKVQSLLSVNIVEPLCETKSFIIYPNPSNGIFNINSLNKILKLIVYNTSGQIVYNSINIENNVDISHVQVGAYFIEIISDKTIEIEKIIINK